jgi:chromosome segregation ATPase
MDLAELAVIVGEIKASMEQLKIDVSAAIEQSKSLENSQRWTRDDISALFTEFYSLQTKVEDIVEEQQQEPETKEETEQQEPETVLDKTNVQEVPKKSRRWGLFD